MIANKIPIGKDGGCDESIACALAPVALNIVLPRLADAVLAQHASYDGEGSPAC